MFWDLQVLFLTFFALFQAFCQVLVFFELGRLENVLTIAESADSFNRFAVFCYLFDIVFPKCRKAGEHPLPAAVALKLYFLSVKIYKIMKRSIIRAGVKPSLNRKEISGKPETLFSR